jgi:histone-lysine N-methyltransferase SETD3
MDTLPQHYRNMPIFFDESELHELKGSLSLQMLQDRKVSLKMEYDNICEYVPEFKRFHHLDFFWARLAVITRIFGFEIGKLKTDGLVAMADMLNHKRPNESSWTFDNTKGDSGCFTITTTKRLLKGAQVFDSYGRKCNSRYFVNYGFSLDFNEDNQTALFFKMPAVAEDASEEENFAHRLKTAMVGPNQRRFQIPFEHKEKVTKKCASYLRIVYATQEDLLTIQKEKKESKEATSRASYEIINPVSLENEYHVIQAIAEACKVCLAGFDTTLEEDNKLLEKGAKPLTMNVRNCILMRRGEKEVCAAWIDLAKTLTEVADKDFRQLRKYCAQKINNRGNKPDFAWRKEKFFEEFWLPMMTTGKVMPDLEEMNNSLGE